MELYFQWLLGWFALFFIAFATLNINSSYEIFTIDEKVESQKLSSVLIPFLSFFVFSIIIYNAIDYKINRKIDKEGVFTKAKVINGEEIITKSLRRGRSESYNLVLGYTDAKTNTNYESKIDVDAEVFNSVYKDQTIEIKYLPSNPSILKVMVGDENIQKFKNISNRKIDFSDIDNLYQLKTDDERFSFLEKMSEGWEKKADSSGITFHNSLKKETIGFSGDGKIYYESDDVANFVPKDEIVNTQEVKLPKNEGVLINVEKIIDTKKYVIRNIDKVTTFQKLNRENYLIIERKP